MGMKIGHISTVVRDLDAGITRFKAVFGVEPRKTGETPHEGVRYAKFAVGGIDLELIEPTTQNAISKYLDRKGEGLHHISFLVDDLPAEMEGLKERGVEIASAYQDTMTFKADDHVSQYILIHPRGANGTLIEFSHHEPV